MNIVRTILSGFLGTIFPDLNESADPNSPKSSPFAFHSSPFAFHSSPFAFHSPKSRTTEKIEELWQTTTKEYISPIALSLNKKSNAEVYAIIIRNSESWNSFQTKLDEIYEDHKSDAHLCNWITEWNHRINNLKIKQALYSLNQDKYLCTQNNSNESLKKTYEEEAKKSLDKRTELLDTIHQEIKAQKVNSQYQSLPYQAILGYLDTHWPALTLFTQTPKIQFKDDGLFYEIKEPKENARAQFLKDITSYTQFLDIGTPAIVLIKCRQGNQKCDIDILKAENLSIEDQLYVEKITAYVVGLLMRGLSSPN